MTGIWPVRMPARRTSTREASQTSGLRTLSGGQADVRLEVGGQIHRRGGGLERRRRVGGGGRSRAERRDVGRRRRRGFAGRLGACGRDCARLIWDSGDCRTTIVRSRPLSPPSPLTRLPSSPPRPPA